jgi:hypothetical protein
MDPNHPIKPPFDMMDKWRLNRKCGAGFENIVADATQWGADQELKACCEWLKAEGCPRTAEDLSAARRPKPLSLKQQALDLLKTDLEPGQEVASITMPAKSIDTIRRALESIPDSK